MKVIDFQVEMKNRKGGVLDTQESSNIKDTIEMKEISMGEELPKLDSKSGFATIKTDEAKRVTYKKTSPKKDVVKKDISLKGIISKEQKKNIISLLKSFGRVIMSNKKLALALAVLMVGSLSVKGIYNSFNVNADVAVDESYVSEFNRKVEDKYLKGLENLSDSISDGEIPVQPVKSDVTPASTEKEKPKTYFSVTQITANFAEEVKGKNSTYSVNIEVAIPTDKISVKVGNVVDIAYNEDDIEILSIDIQDNFNREYLNSMSVDEKTVKDIESLIDKEKESVREKIYGKSKQEFMSVIDKAIKESINL